jgi:hypothetical protein
MVGAAVNEAKELKIVDCGELIRVGEVIGELMDLFAYTDSSLNMPNIRRNLALSSVNCRHLNKPQLVEAFKDWRSKGGRLAFGPGAFAAQINEFTEKAASRQALGAWFEPHLFDGSTNQETLQRDDPDAYERFCMAITMGPDTTISEYVQGLLDSGIRVPRTLLDQLVDF